MALEPRQIILRPVVTERSYALADREKKAYTFEVAPSANKIEIREAVEKLFPSAKVEKVRVMHVRGKARRVRFARGYTTGWKKAIVYLKQGTTIDII